MEFICFFEKSEKEEETYVHFLQFTGNEKQLKKFSVAIEKAHSKSYSIDIENRVSERTVDDMMRVNGPNSYAPFFVKHVGKFKSPISIHTTGHSSPERLFYYLEECLYCCHIEDHFSTGCGEDSGTDSGTDSGESEDN
jgi:hypothetical protein